VRPNKRIFNNAKVSDHFAIVPTGNSTAWIERNGTEDLRSGRAPLRRGVLPGSAIRSHDPDHDRRGRKFKTDGKIIVDPGWLAVYGRQAEARRQRQGICSVVPGEPAKVENIEVKENVTKPPPRYNEATLLSAMEGAGKLVDDEELREAMAERGLGTPATRAQVIEGLLMEGYLIRQGRDLIVTAKGISLIYAVAQFARRDPDKAGTHRRMGAQASANGARTTCAWRVHDADPRSHD